MSEARRTAACLAVGSELLGDHRLDSNSLTITHTLARREWWGIRWSESPMRSASSSPDTIWWS
jgi:hypothetical protein